MQGVLDPASIVKTGTSLTLRPATRTTDGNGDSSVDCLGFEYALVVIHLGAIASGGNATFKVMSSSDDGSADAFAAITGATYELTGTDDNTARCIAVRLSDNERFLRVDYDETATGSSAVSSASIHPFGPRDSAHLGTRMTSVV
jgi:hypothetical protein